MTNLEEAKQRIIKVRERNESKLNLDDLDLTSQNLAQLIPVIEKVLPHLSELDLSGNKLEKLPNSLAHFTHLKRLSLDDNNLDNLPESLAKLYLEDSLDIISIDETKKLFKTILKGRYPVGKILDEAFAEILKKALTDKSEVEQESNKDSTAVKSVSYENLYLFKYIEPRISLKRIPGARSSSEINLGKIPEKNLKKSRHISV